MPLGRYLQVNIYNRKKLLIKFLGRNDVFISMGMNSNLFERIRESNPEIEIYTSEEDPYRGNPNIAFGSKTSQQEKTQENQPTSNQVAEPTFRTDAIITSKETEFKPDSIDEMIEKKLLESNEDTNIPSPGEKITLTDQEIRDIADLKGMRKYEKELLERMSKTELKKILNVERGFTQGHPHYGGYHDKHPDLVRYVIESQEIEIGTEIKKD
jgi:hypothetical protein